MARSKTLVWQSASVWALYAVGLVPAVWYFYLGATGQLPGNSVKIFEHLLGIWALRFLLASLTDLLDGLIARRFRLETRLGKLLDPAADKILTAAAFISLVEQNPAVVPAWMVVG